MDLDMPSFSDELADLIFSSFKGMPFWSFAFFALTLFGCYWFFSPVESMASDCASPYVCIEATND